ncbi:DUF1353 domain-containing protein [Synechococcus sp. RSCCF101]|uniref:DUF1353 domain-containing protein n=1 Tax=Synechococcus sp. RSCCF101 TaxID=2511069 RepID=UPI001245A5BC|nr:DUF1353 domain-containing protein [Synechococcus sp. RSCCF101]QEY31223.1 DUF1353 domain-containing protein [Synechococcus sp. RSCCF101]
MSSHYQGKFSFIFDRNRLPLLKPILLPTTEKGALGRIWAASRRRSFTLEYEWKATIANANFASHLNGEIIIPVEHGGKPLEFDGASVPMPWLVGMLSFGVLRPLGILLTASIVHDYAFCAGGLKYSSGDSFRVVTRQEADRLFREIVTDVNEMPFWGFLAWCAVRLGWVIGIKYAGKRFTESPPWLPLVVLFAVITALTLIVNTLGLTTFVLLTVAIYALAYTVRAAID